MAAEIELPWLSKQNERLATRSSIWHWHAFVHTLGEAGRAVWIGVITVAHAVADPFPFPHRTCKDSLKIIQSIVLMIWYSMYDSSSNHWRGQLPVGFHLHCGPSNGRPVGIGPRGPDHFCLWTCGRQGRKCIGRTRKREENGKWKTTDVSSFWDCVKAKEIMSTTLFSICWSRREMAAFGRWIGM